MAEAHRFVLFFLLLTVFFISASSSSSSSTKPLHFSLHRSSFPYRKLLSRPISRIQAFRRSLQNSSSVSSPELASLVISGSSVGAGEYFASLSIGTPPQKLFLIPDTGSDLTWMKCSPCSSADCSPTNRSFNPPSSSTFSPVSCLSKECSSSFFPPVCLGLSGHCKYSYSYTDQSFTSGSLVFESITLGSGSGQEVKIDNLLLGCGSQYSGTSFEKSGGVIGLGRGPLSLSSQLAAQQSYANKFSYCLADFFGPSWISGVLAFGESTFDTALQYTPLVTNPFAESFYYVNVEEIKVAGAALAIPASVWNLDPQGNGGTIVDSGTTLAQIADPAYGIIRNAFQQAVHYPLIDPIGGLDLCYNVSGITDIRFPELSITLQGNLILLPPQDNYFTDVADGIKCLAMQEVPPSFSVIGNLLQQNYHVEFDKLHNRLGFAPANCSKIHNSLRLR